MEPSHTTSQAPSKRNQARKSTREGKKDLSGIAESLSQKLDRITEQFDSHHAEHTAKQIEELEREIKDLSKTVHNMEGGFRYVIIAFTIASVMFTAGSIMGFYKIYQYEKLEESTKGINQLLVKQVENQTRDVINKFNIAKSSDQEKEDVKNLKTLTEFLEQLKPNDQKFEGTKALVNILYQIVVTENMEEASRMAEEAIKIYTPDNFVVSRAKTLSVLIPVAEDRNEISDKEREDRLRDAILKDNTNAGAFNSLGIIVANKACKQLINGGDFSKAYGHMREAILNFEIAALLNPSATGKLKYFNNKTWCNLLILRYLLNKEGTQGLKITTFLQDNNYVSVEEFFEDSALGVKLYKEYTDFPNPPETLAQLFWLQAEYKRSDRTYSEEEVNSLEDKGAKEFEKALERKIFNRTKTPAHALEQFKTDYLHQYFIKRRPDLADQLCRQISGERCDHASVK